jgi:hypothetical protein
MNSPFKIMAFLTGSLSGSASFHQPHRGGNTF